MIKGGFQGLDISGVDLTAQSPTLPGAYATCAGADGKPIRVQTADGQVECSVKKVSTNYVLAGVTGDGKILSITVGSTDGITVTEIPSAEEPEEYLDVAVDISDATSSVPYTTMYDGIFRLEYAIAAQSSLGADVDVIAKAGPTHTTGLGLLRLSAGAAAGSRVAVFVKKGTMVYVSRVAENISVKFIPYKPVQS